MTLRTPRPSPIGTRIARLSCTGVAGLVLVALVVATLQNAFLGLLTSKPATPYPQSIYYAMAVPGTSPFQDAPGAAGADLSRVYKWVFGVTCGEWSLCKPASIF
jgi:hypothetical protein